MSYGAEGGAKRNERMVTVAIRSDEQNYEVERTEGSFDGDWSRLLGFFAEAQLVDSLNTEHVGFSFAQTTNHKPADAQSTG